MRQANLCVCVCVATLTCTMHLCISIGSSIIDKSAYKLIEGYSLRRFVRLSPDQHPMMGHALILFRLDVIKIKQKSSFPLRHSTLIVGHFVRVEPNQSPNMLPRHRIKTTKQLIVRSTEHFAPLEREAATVMPARSHRITDLHRNAVRTMRMLSPLYVTVAAASATV